MPSIGMFSESRAISLAETCGGDAVNALGQGHNLWAALKASQILRRGPYPSHCPPVIKMLSGSLCIAVC